MVFIIAHRFIPPIRQLPIIASTHLFHCGGKFGVIRLVYEFVGIFAEMVKFIGGFEAFGGIGSMDVFHVLCDDGECMGGRVAPDIDQCDRFVDTDSWVIVDWH